MDFDEVLIKQYIVLLVNPDDMEGTDVTDIRIVKAHSSEEASSKLLNDYRITHPILMPDEGDIIMVIPIENCTLFNITLKPSLEDSNIEQLKIETIT